MKIHWHVLSYIFGLDLYNSSITNLKESTHLTIDYLKLGFFSVTYRSTLHKKRTDPKKYNRSTSTFTRGMLNGQRKRLQPSRVTETHPGYQEARELHPSAQ